MRTQLQTALLASLILGGSAYAWAQALTFAQEYSVPEWARTAMTRSGFDATFAFDAQLNPFSHRADFDGDGTQDFAALVRNRVSGKKGVAFIHRGTGRAFIVGAGNKIPNGADDFGWMDAWAVFDKGVVPQGATAELPPVLKGDALLVFKTEASSAILWWTGTQYQWYQQGD